MAAGVLAPFVSAAGSILGSTLSANAANRAARLNAIAAANATMAANAQNDRQFATSFQEAKRQFQLTSNEAKKQYRQGRADDLHDEQIALREANVDRAIQKEFAQNGVQWRAADARAAGIHPLAALGMQGVSSQPIQIGSHVASGQVASGSVPTGHSSMVSSALPYAGSSGLGEALKVGGQDLGRAISAMQTELERDRDMERASAVLNINKQQMENQLLAAQIRRINQAGNPPAVPFPGGRNPIPGQSGSGPSSGDLQIKPVTATRGYGPNQSMEKESLPSIGWERTPTGGYFPQVSQEIQQRMEDNPIASGMWALRTYLGMATGAVPPPPIQPPVGKEWWMNPGSWEFQTRDKRWFAKSWPKWLPPLGFTRPKD